MKIRFLRNILAGSLLCLNLGMLHAANAPLNVLLITADDLGYEAMDFLQGGCHGTVPNVTPNISKLSSEGLNFQYGFVNAAICAPSRGIIATGCYGHNSGLFGFNKLSKDVPTVFGEFQKFGYLTGILGKVSHSTPDLKFKWDFEHDYQELGAGRSPTKYHDFAAEFFERCKKENKPFYFMVNSHDPHRPFYDPEGKGKNGEEVPSRLYKPEEIYVPDYLADLPGVRKEIATYYNSVRRLDDTIGRVLAALEASGLAENTLVIFITDNGSSFPFSKANTYLASNRTPMVVRWPGVIKPGTSDSNHFVSEVDFLPTFMEAAGLQIPAGLDGRSFLPILKGGTQDGRERVFTQIDYTAGGPAKPMRCVQDKQYAYIFNAYSDGKTIYKNSNEGDTFATMEEAAKTNPDIKARCDMFRYRVPQEFYDLEKDPGCKVNLIKDPQKQDLVKKYQATLRDWMVKTNDFCMKAFDVRETPAQLADAMAHYPELLNKRKESEGETAVSAEETAGAAAPANDKNAARKEHRASKRKNK